MSPPEWLLNSGFPKELVVLLIAVLPVLELRVAIPVGINTFGMPWYHAFPLAFIGNLIPVPIIILFLEAITRWLSKIEFFRRALDWLFEHTRRRGRIVEKYKRIGLMLFVAIPLLIHFRWDTYCRCHCHLPVPSWLDWGYNCRHWTHQSSCLWLVENLNIVTA
ncbi:hypothetical protein ES703_77732 [subsurface metagenome]